MTPRIVPAQAPMDFGTEQQAFERRRRMAELLAQQAGQPMPVGQVVGNRFVAPTAVRGLAQLLDSYTAGQELRDLDRQQSDSIRREQEGASQEMAAITQALLGGSAPTQAGMTAGLDEQDYNRAQVAPDPRRAMSLALESRRPQMQQLGQSLLTAQLAQQRENPFARINPSDYTPESLAAFTAGGGRDYALLQPRVKSEFVNTGGQIVPMDPYTGRPSGQAIPRTVSPDAALSNDTDLFKWRNLSPYQLQSLGLDRARVANDNARLFFDTGMQGAGVPRPPATPFVAPPAAPFGPQAAPMPAPAAPVGAPAPTPAPMAGPRPAAAPVAGVGAPAAAPGAAPTIPPGITPRDFSAVQRAQLERQLNPQPPSEGQAKAVMFGARMDAADQELRQLAERGVLMGSLANRAAESVPMVGGALRMLTNQTVGPLAQRAEQAERDFINAVLRRESGAVISPMEFANARLQYFPQPGDSPEVVERKAANRRIAIEGMRAEAGPNFTRPMDDMVRRNFSPLPTDRNGRLQQPLPGRAPQGWSVEVVR